VIAALLFALFLVFMTARLPVAMAITLATIIAMLAGGYDLRSIPQIMAKSTQSVPLLAVPFFILAANLMNALGLTQRIFDFATALVGFVRGGLAQVNVLASMIFAGISGAAVADAAGLGTIEIRAMTRAGYGLPFSAAVTLASSTIGPIIPPSIMMVIYAITANVSIAQMFLAGLLPGVVIALVLMITIYYRVASGRQACPPPVAFSWRRLGKTALDGLLALMAPAIILWGMVGGVVTPTEAGVLAVAYSLLIGLVYRSYDFRAIRQVLRESIVATALIMYIVAVSSVMSWLLVNEGTAHLLTEQLAGLTDNPVLFLLVVNIFLLVVGCILETLPAMLITVPILMPSVEALGIDPVHFGVVVIFNLLIGIITPPMGIGLYILMGIARVGYGELVRASAPFLITMIVALLVLTYVPEISLFLPEALMR
jgi:tripartite ATP-independent transporter DctM subunit